VVNASFLARSHIRWGELVRGVVVVGCLFRSGFRGSVLEHVDGGLTGVFRRLIFHVGLTRRFSRGVHDAALKITAHVAGGMLIIADVVGSVVACWPDWRRRRERGLGCR